MGTNHLRRAFQKALLLAQLAEDHRVLGGLVREGWFGIAQYNTPCIACGGDLEQGQRYEKAHFVQRPLWARFVHEKCPSVQAMIDELRSGQHEDLVMHSFPAQGGGRCDKCSTRFTSGDPAYDVRPFGIIALEGKIYERRCKECVSVFN